MAFVATALTTGQRAAAGHVYADSLDALRTTVGAFVRQYGGDYHEMRADADLIFMRAFCKFDGGKGSDKPWDLYLNYWIWYTLLDTKRTAARRVARRAVLYVADQLEDVAEVSFDAVQLMHNLGEDAAMVLNLTLETPAEIMNIVRAKGGEDRNLRSTLRSHLRDLGWTVARITESFTEIGKALA